MSQAGSRDVDALESLMQNMYEVEVLVVDLAIPDSGFLTFSPHCQCGVWHDIGSGPSRYDFGVRTVSRDERVGRAHAHALRVAAAARSGPWRSVRL